MHSNSAPKYLTLGLDWMPCAPQRYCTVMSRKKYILKTGTVYISRMFTVLSEPHQSCNRSEVCLFIVVVLTVMAIGLYRLWWYSRPKYPCITTSTWVSNHKIRPDHVFRANLPELKVRTSEFLMCLNIAFFPDWLTFLFGLIANSKGCGWCSCCAVSSLELNALKTCCIEIIPGFSRKPTTDMMRL